MDTYGSFPNCTQLQQIKMMARQVLQKYDELFKQYKAHDNQYNVLMESLKERDDMLDDLKKLIKSAKAEQEHLIEKYNLEIERRAEAENFLKEVSAENIVLKRKLYALQSHLSQTYFSQITREINEEYGDTDHTSIEEHIDRNMMHHFNVVGDVHKHMEQTEAQITLLDLSKDERIEHNNLPDIYIDQTEKDNTPLEQVSDHSKVGISVGKPAATHDVLKDNSHKHNKSYKIDSGQTCLESHSNERHQFISEENKPIAETEDNIISKRKDFQNNKVIVETKEISEQQSKVGDVAGDQDTDNNPKPGNAMREKHRGWTGTIRNNTHKQDNLRNDEHINVPEGSNGVHADNITQHLDHTDESVVVPKITNGKETDKENKTHEQSIVSTNNRSPPLNKELINAQITTHEEGNDTIHTRNTEKFNEYSDTDGTFVNEAEEVTNEERGLDSDISSKQKGNDGKQIETYKIILEEHTEENNQSKEINALHSVRKRLLNERISENKKDLNSKNTTHDACAIENNIFNSDEFITEQIETKDKIQFDKDQHSVKKADDILEKETKAEKTTHGENIETAKYLVNTPVEIDKGQAIEKTVIQEVYLHENDLAIVKPKVQYHSSCFTILKSTEEPSEKMSEKIEQTSTEEEYTMQELKTVMKHLKKTPHEDSKLPVLSEETTTRETELAKIYKKITGIVWKNPELFPDVDESARWHVL